MTFDNGESYNGYYKNGMRNGFGTHYLPDGFTIQGMWVDGILSQSSD
ncbi:hypothetical protein BGP_2572 [Beggiatoa sp. PS]|nr:hypothetical protein BGP_2572 [Beggiatoa sp. PS]